MSYNTIAKSKALRNLYQKSGYNIPRTHKSISKKIKAYYGHIKEKIINEIKIKFGKSYKIHISCDQWTSISNKHFMNVNIFFCDGTLFNLGLDRLVVRSDAEYLLNSFKRKLKQFDIKFDKDIMSITSDGASVMVALGRNSNKEHQTCINHGIHLAVLDMLKKIFDGFFTNEDRNIPEMETSSYEEDDSDEQSNENFGVTYGESFDILLSNIRQIIKNFKRSPKNNDILLIHISSNTQTNSQLILDCKTRWNSLVGMLSIYIKNIDAIKKACIDCKIIWNLSERDINFTIDFLEAISSLKELVKVLSRDTTIFSTQRFF